MDVTEIGVTVSESISQAVFAYGLTIVVAALTAGMIWLVVRILDHLHHRREAAKVTAPVPVSVTPEPPAVDETAHHVAAVAAAVYAVLGAHRLVYVGDAVRAHTWSATGRTIHHFSHSPKRSSEQR